MDNKKSNLSFSKGGKVINEDVAFSTENYGWVLDGATGLTNDKITTGDSDAQYFVNKWSEFLKSNINDYDKSLKEIMFEGMEYIKNIFINELHVNFDEINPAAMPSAGGVVVRKNGNVLEYISIGDCSLLIKNSNGLISSIRDDSLSKLDKKALSELKGYMEEYNYSFIKAREGIADTLIKHRLMSNKKDGYWILSFNPEALENCLIGQIELNVCDGVFIASDGFMAIVDTYNELTKEELISYVSEGRVSEIYNKIRDIEERDSSCEKYVRFKKSDDASCIFIKFSR